MLEFLSGSGGINTFFDLAILCFLGYLWVREIRKGGLFAKSSGMNQLKQFAKLAGLLFLTGLFIVMLSLEIPLLFE